MKSSSSAADVDVDAVLGCCHDCSADLQAMRSPQPRQWPRSTHRSTPCSRWTRPWEWRRWDAWSETWKVFCNLGAVLSCALLLVFSGLKRHILVTQCPKYTRLRGLQTSYHLCPLLSNPYKYYCHVHLLSVTILFCSFAY